MSTVFTHMTMSLDGFIADPQDGIDDIFDWYDAGDVEVPSANQGVSLRVDEASAGMLSDLIGRTGALVSGRRLFDITDGWGDSHPVGAPVVVVTHRPPPDADRWPRTTFVGDVADAVARAREIAGDKDVTIASANVAQQALALGLVDEACVSLAPVLLGEGIPYFANLPARLILGDPEVVQGRRAVHLRYPVRR
ncbi:dihydrofolate reductase family protein [Promicromonospora thailandica]|uniref:Dihydrofolate reductase n=1 Tax=Promicromonospora thailandica TaxID=765201 RepID=A0A9X2JZ65_9MICO|nr:dihydrofolate reductase family protein [Promicromonospora thailandica]MCP2265774.1 Dihydrofolate reductase [Promicromonospora thailandica]BFF21796.1 dihydrofolate reductase family protein [Promicromonospora thailandica]